MNKHVDPRHPFSAHSAIGEPSFADVLQAIASDDHLSDGRKRHWSTSLRKMAEYIDRPMPTMPARISGISQQVLALHPARLGVNDKTFANHRANAKAALNWFKDCRGGLGRAAAMTAAYRELLVLIGNRHHRDLISPFFRFLSMQGVEPGSIGDEHLTAYVAYCSETKFRPLRNSTIRSLSRHFNQHAETIKEWPDVALSVPAAICANDGLPWDQVPAGLRSDIEAVLKRRSRARESASGRRLRGCKQSTLNLIERKLKAAVRMAARTGIPIDELSSLAALLHPDRSEMIIDAYWRTDGEQPGIYTIDLATLFLDLARSETELDGESLRRLEDMRATLEEHRRSGLTDKNMTLIRQVLATDSWAKVVGLPRRILAGADAFRRTQPIKSAVSAQLAVAITLLTMAPVRMRNLATIRIGHNLIRPNGPAGAFHLIFAANEVKNEEPLEFPLNAQVTAMIETFIHDHRPGLMRSHNHDYLFPGEAGGHKDMKTLGGQITKRIAREIGLTITPHQFRHAAAALILRTDRGNYELVRRVLGHKSLGTTTSFYIGLESLSAAERFGQIVTAMLPPDDAQPCKPKRHRG
ncbi:tyrosine-type recombinase/integrase [Mesorhizobium sp. VNQ89]|uniref:tyrosine-type recombinase/integrase n=1 Tax=Mesorhizobium quangtriensis TaxID=3157709 RepID=UPI0032B73C17